MIYLIIANDFNLGLDGASIYIILKRAATFNAIILQQAKNFSNFIIK